MERWVKRWWMLFGLSLFLLIPVDLIMTLFAVAQHGVAVEVNPFMRWLIAQGLIELVVANLVVAGLTVIMFHTLIKVVRETPVPYRDTVIHGITIWIALVFTAGIALTANHVLILV